MATYLPPHLPTIQEFEKERKEDLNARDLRGRSHVLVLNSQSSLSLQREHNYSVSVICL